MGAENKITVDVVIPTYHPDERFDLLISRLQQQTIKPQQIIIIRTKGEHQARTSIGKKLIPMAINVGTYKTYKNIKIVEIEKEQFDHGATRNLGASYSSADYLLFMTQDAVPTSKRLIEALICGFDHPVEKLPKKQPFDGTAGGSSAGSGANDVAVVYARQAAASNAGIIEKYVRRFNYPQTSQKKSMKDLSKLGIKTYFNSNVCSCYKRSVFEQLGGFVNHTNFNEDMFYAADAISHGYSIVYQSKARVIHSHRYTCMQQFHRNFDNGVSQKQYQSLLGEVKPEGEGMKLVKGMVRHLAVHGRFLLIPYFIVQCMFRYAGYYLGKHYDKLPKSVCRRLSSNRGYWK